MEVDERNNSMSVTGRTDIGRPREVSTKIQKFKGTIWLCENYPISLPRAGNTSAKRSAEKPPQTAEAIAARRDERRQKILSKYGYSSFPTLPVTATSPSSMASSSISQAPPSN
ncbi:ankyrin repeat domain-containing protein 13B [Caerostris extrusa]|uniref:Ankyrin repeat domain-containing protein 13B n=1 Tax=Caerostris extrusa TaxID=172846 RepID=A0AAV4NFK1_CAEEX|nr:ankyrin repeat domain-containing protein 13B [Caerostris extrusa]